MPIYGYENLYGSPLIYGQESVGLRIVPEIDWWASSNFTGASEWPNLLSMSVERGRKYLVNRNGKGFTQAEVGKATMKLNNRDARYDPHNTLSPLYPYVRPKQLFRLTALYGTTAYTLIQGRTNDVDPVGGKRSVANISGGDGWASLKSEFSLPIQEGQNSEVLLGMILDEVNWPTFWGRDIGSGAAMLGYWWADRQSAKDALHSLAHAELGQVWIANSGAFKFRSRHDIPTTTATITDLDVDKNAGYSVAQPWDVIRNRVEVKGYPQVLQSMNVLWKLEEKTTILNGKSWTTWIDYTYNNQTVPAKNVETSPSVFSVNTAEDGSGTDLTSGCTVTVTPFSKRAKVVVTNNSGSEGIVTSLEVSGQAIATPYTQSMYAENTASQSVYDLMDFVLDEKWLQDLNDAQNFADFLVATLSKPRPYVEFWLLPNLSLQLGLDLQQRYQLDITELGVSGAYNLIWFGHYWELDKDALNMRTRVLFEPAADIGSSTYMQFPYQFEVNSDFAL